MVALRMPIPAEMREQLANDPFMSRCILEPLFCDGRIQWHHAFNYAGKRQNELWAILPMCELHHREEYKYKDAQIAAMTRRITEFGLETEAANKFPRSQFIKSLLSPTSSRGADAPMTN